MALAFFLASTGFALVGISFRHYSPVPCGPPLASAVAMIARVLTVPTLITNNSKRRDSVLVLERDRGLTQRTWDLERKTMERESPLQNP